jgi:hypothetical protein
MDMMEQETLPPLVDGIAPQTVDEIWAGFDPRKEPLDVEILKEWEDDGVVLQVLRYRIGIFKGQKAMMAAVYGYPKGSKALPGLVQIHGGGQYAHSNACLTNAKRGYASISISWGGRIDAPDYRVSPDEVKLFWDGKTDDPNYKLITDWGAVDGYHHPCRCGGDGFGKVEPDSWSLDEVPSPRNNSWFLCALGARRALTFLEQQPEVDGEKLGVYGHSMGGKLTVMVAGTDDRVKAAAPSCGGVSHRDSTDELSAATICDDAYLKRITCPVMFLSPSNDFHGRIDDLPTSVDEIQTSDWRLTCAAHHNHQDTAPYEVATQIWMDQHLKGSFEVPGTPQTELTLETDSGSPCLTVKPDAARPILSVEIYYTQQGQADGKPDDRENTGYRFWHLATVTKSGDVWTAELPVLSTDRPLWVYANVTYPLDEPVTGAGYYYRTYTTETFNLSSLVQLVSADELKEAGVKAAMKPSLMIETFEGDWEKAWFSYCPAEWARTTHKVYDPKWAAPEGATLALDVRCAQANTLAVGLDGYATAVSLEGGPGWQHVTLAAAEFHNGDDDALSDWAGLKELRLGPSETLRPSEEGADPVILGGDWQGAAPEFRNLRWVAE